MDMQGDTRRPASFGRQPTEPTGREEQAATKFTQICASQNDLFALDEDGNVHQYNFNTQAWVKLATNRAHEESA